jgi:hypothetical protein
MLTSNGRTVKLSAFITSLVLAALAVAARSPAHATPEVAPANNIRIVANSANVLQDVTFAGMFNDDDAAYLRESLELLRDKMPTWEQYVEEAKPFLIAIDLTEGAHGRAAIAKCCLAGNRGQITFGDHLGRLTDSTDPDSQSPEARRITFLATFAHEVTHLRDQRAGHYLSKTDWKSCVAAERSGLEKQLVFQQDALTAALGDTPAATQVYRLRLQQNVQAEAAALASRHLWDQYCGAFAN